MVRNTELHLYAVRQVVLLTNRHASELNTWPGYVAIWLHESEGFLLVLARMVEPTIDVDTSLSMSRHFHCRGYSWSKQIIKYCEDWPTKGRVAAYYLAVYFPLVLRVD